METNSTKEAADNAFLAIFRDYSEEGVRQYIDAEFVQHNPFVPTGRDAAIGLLPALKESGISYTNHRILQDGEFVALHNPSPTLMRSVPRRSSRSTSTE